jgi:hypothetical protein
MSLAIVSAMREELRALLPLLAGARVQRCAGRDFHVGTLAGRPAVIGVINCRLDEITEAGDAQIHRGTGGIPAAFHSRGTGAAEPRLDARHGMEDHLD